jgi:glycosyltransferase involved in cell wall biosynthesis
MKLGYLLSIFPLISETFVRKEIEAVEAMGHPVQRFAARQWTGQLVDPKDIAAQGKTDYLITGGKGRLLGDALKTLLGHPLRVLGALPLWLQLYRNGYKVPEPFNGGHVPHIAYLIEAMALRTRAKRLGISHIHVHFSSSAATIALLSAQMGGPSYSFTVHGPYELVATRELSLALKVKGAAFVAAISDYCRGRIIADAPGHDDKIRVIRCGLQLEEFAFDPVPPQSARIVCVGRLCDAKGQRHIPAAVAQVRDEFPELVVELLGGGDEEALIRSEIEKYGVQDNVILRGWASGDMVRQTVAASRALLLPSYAEGLPVVIMEALAIGRPVLSTRIAGTPELVDAGCGWLFQPGDVDAIAQALREVMRASPEQRAAMGAEGRRRVEERHDMRKSARLLVQAFEETAEP